MGNRIGLLCTLIVNIGIWANAQQYASDSLKTVYLNEVVVSESFLKGSETGLSERPVDSLLLLHSQGKSLPEALRLLGVQIRSYGANGLTTPSFRGTGGSHTSVLWNGINLQSPLSGQLDLSQVPIGFVENIQLQKGGAGSLYGSGAIGGTIQLENKSCFNEGWTFSSSHEAGSFADYYQSYKAGWSGHRFVTSTRVFRRTLKNDYPYINKNILPAAEEKRTHAAIDHWGMLHQNSWRISEQQVMDVKLWYQDNELEVPNPILARGNPQAIQKDEFVRGLLTWNLGKETFGIVYKQAYLWHQLNFTDPNGPTPESTSTFRTWVSRVEANINWFNDSELIVGLNHNREKGIVDNFGGTEPVRNNTAFYLSLRYPVNEQLQLSINAREEHIDRSFSPFMPSFGANYMVNDRLLVKGSISRNYRIPTFNDLYWIGSWANGTPDLSSELSLNYEGGLEYHLLKKPTNELKVGATFFGSLVDNWIEWQQNSKGNWMPENVKKVFSRGIETRLEGLTKTGNIAINWNINYSFTKTTNKETTTPAPRELNKQLAYTPLHEGSTFVEAGYKGVKWAITYTFTGKQYTDGENNERFALPSYQLAGSHLSKSFSLRHISGNMRFAVNNVFNVNYENRRGYPMPRRNYSIGLDLKFNKQSNHDQTINR